MKDIIANIVRGGGKPLSYLLAALFAFALAETAQAAHTWRGKVDGDLSNKNNYNDFTYSLYFNVDSLQDNKVTDLFLSKNLSGSVKLTDSSDTRYRGYQFQKGSWQLNGTPKGTTYSIDNSGGNATDNKNNDKDRIVIGCQWKGQVKDDATLRMYAINIKTRKILVGANVASSPSKGTLILDERDENGTYYGPVVITLTGAANSDANVGDTSGNDFQLYNGRIESTAATVTIPGVLNMGYSDNASTELTINSGTWKTARLWMSRNNNNVAKLYVKGGLLQTTGEGDNGRITVGTTDAMSTNYVEISGGTVDCSSGTAFRLGGAGNANAWSEMLVNGGTLKCKDLYVGDGSSAKATITSGLIDGSPGYVYFAFGSGCEADEFCELNLNGGTITTKKFVYRNGTSPATLNLNGGTIKVATDSAGAEFLNDYPNLTVNVGADGAVFDLNGQNITVSEPLNAAAGAAGDLTVTNSGTVAFAGMGDLAGAFTIGENTALRYFDQDDVVSNYTVSALNIGPGATLYLNADATGCDTFNAATTNITATTENPAKIKLILTSIPAPTAKFSLFKVDDADKITVEAETTAGAALEVAKIYENGVLSYSILAREYTWNDGTTGANWSADDKWLLDSAAATWANNNIAVFASAGDSVALDSDVTAVKLDFQADATVAAGEGTLTVPSVSVDPGISAMINAPTSGSLEKTGGGTLTLTQNRSAQTTVSDGKLAMDGATVDASKLMLGSDALHPAVFDYGGQTLEGDPRLYMASGSDITFTNGTFNTTGTIWLNSTSGYPSVMTIAKDASMISTTHYNINTTTSASGDFTLNIPGGVVKSTKKEDNFIMQQSLSGRMNINVTDGGVLEFGGEVYALTCRDTVNGSTAFEEPALHIMLSNATLRVANGKSFRLGYDGSNNKNPQNPDGVIAATNSVIDLAYGLFIGNSAIGANTAGGHTADFENCIITGRQIAVYQDRPLNAVRFNNTHYVVNTNLNYWLETAEAFETMGEGGTAIKPMSIGPGGLVLDSNGYDGQVRADLQGDGAFTKTGSGKLTVMRNQTGIGPFVCEEGEVFISEGLSISRPVTVTNAATLTVKATKQSTLAGLTLGAGTTLNIDSYTLGVTPLAVTTLALPAEGAAMLKKGGGTFAKGYYEILSKTGIVVADVSGKLVPAIAEGSSYEWLVKDDTLILAVDVPTSGNVWTGFAGDGKMSTGDNWLSGTAPMAGAALDFSGVTTSTTIDGDIDATFGAVTMGSGVITFTGTNMAATSFSNTAKITVGANATVTLDGDLIFDGVGQPVSGGAFFIVNKVDANGTFIVSGTVKATSIQNIKPVIAAGSGCIVVNRVEIPAGKSFYSTLDVNTQKWAIGPGGITAGEGGNIWCLSNKANDCWIYPYTNDFTVSAWTVVRDAIDHHELNTTGYGDGLPHTITLDAGFADKGLVYLAGTGKVVVNYVPTEAGGKGAYSGNVTVQDTVTLAINAGKKLTTGSITFAAGTTLEVPSTGVEMGAIAFSGEGTVTLKVSDASLADGEYTLITSTKDLSAEVLTRFAVSANTASDMCLIMRDARTLCLFVGSRAAEGLYVWTGKTGGGNANTDGNWLAGAKPAVGANVLIASAGTINNDLVGFAPSSITFGYGVGKVTINGENAITGVTSITNNSSVSHTINVPVYFVGDIKVKQAAMAENGDLTKAHITFAGGAYAAPGYALENGDSAAVFSRCIFGVYHLGSTAGNRWSARYQGSGKRICVAENSTLHIPYAGVLTELYAAGNSRVFVGDIEADTGRLCWKTFGEYTITNLYLIGSGDRFATYNQGTDNPAVFKIERIDSAMTGNWFYFADGNAVAKNVFYIGKGGLNFASGSAGSYCIGRNTDGDSNTLRPWYSDFTIAEGRNYSLVFNRDAILCTDDESGTGRTITIEGKTRGQNYPVLTISGSGTVEINGGNNNQTAPTIVVTNTATLAIKPGAGFGETAMTVNSNATLKVNGSGTVTLGGNLTLKTGSALGFNYTGVRMPVLAFSEGKAVTFDEGETTNIVVKISTDADVRGRGGEITSGGKFKNVTGVSLASGHPDWALGVRVNDDGNIVLDAKPTGLIFFVK